MGRDSFVFYRSFYESIKELPTENQSNVYNAVFEYALNRNEVELCGVEKAIFSLIKPQIDANQNKYENGCKGGRPKKENQAETKQKPKQNQNKTKVKPNENENENVNVNDNKKESIKEKALSEDKSSSSDTAKASKHKYGEFKHVLLKDEELQALQRDYPNWEELIKFLDEYIEEKGYKSKSHYLCIKRWVMDAVAEKKNRSAKKINNVYQTNDIKANDFSKFYI